jgi:voltage-gated potassium channel
VIGYRVIGGSWMNAIYMTANVLTTAGFREAVDIANSPSAQAFTVVLLFFGAGTIVYSTSVITAFVVEGDLTEGFRSRRMQRVIQQMQNHYIVCGAGATGFAVLKELVNTQRQVVAIELHEERAQRVSEHFPTIPVMKEDFTDDEVLARAGIARAAGIVICTTIDKDLLVTTITARQLNPRLRIVSRARTTARRSGSGMLGPTPWCRPRSSAGCAWPVSWCVRVW